MLKFVSLSRTMPDKRQAEDRAQNFHEIYSDFAKEKAKEQAS
jgi:glutamate synthase (NADPH/NADH) small chain